MTCVKFDYFYSCTEDQDLSKFKCQNIRNWILLTNYLLNFLARSRKSEVNRKFLAG
jgi:hypothetical protein